MTRDELLVVVVALSDAIHAVPRSVDWLSSLPAECFRRRRLFKTHGVRLRGFGGATVAQRKQHERLVARAVSAGLIERHVDGQRVFLKLTLEGESLARALANLPALDEAALLARTVARDYCDGVCEVWLLRRIFGRPEHRDRVWLDLVATAAAGRGWLRTESTINGLAVLFPADPPGDEMGVPSEPKVKTTRALQRLYGSTFRRCRAEMRSNYNSEIGLLPLPTSEAEALGQPRGTEVSST